MDRATRLRSGGSRDHGVADREGIGGGPRLEALAPVGPPPEPPIAHLLDGTPYRVEARLATGGMGDLFAATDRGSGEPVVVKVLRPELAAQRDAHERMRVEGEAIWILSHPHIVAGRGRGVTADGRPYVAMERLQGRTLRTEARLRGPLPPPEAIRHTRQLLSALRAVHAAGVVHRDVKPDNVMLCATGAHAVPSIKLIDFGIAKVIGQRQADRVSGPGRPEQGRPGHRPIAPIAVPTLEGICVGTPRYVSPEQASGAPIDPRSDVYAAGILLYTLVAGRGPFDEIRDVVELLKAHRDRAPPPPSQVAKVPIPPLLEGVILRAISKNPGDRFGSALAFSHALWKTVSRMSVGHPRGERRLADVRGELGPPRRDARAEPAGAGGCDPWLLGPAEIPRGDAVVLVLPRPAAAGRAAAAAGSAAAAGAPAAGEPPAKEAAATAAATADARRAPQLGLHRPAAATGRLPRRRCRPWPRTPWLRDAGLVFGAAAFGAAAGALSTWLIL